MPTNIFKNTATIIFLFILVACNNNKKDEALFKAMDESLTASNNQLRHDIINIFSIMHKRLEEPENVEKAKYYMPLMESITNQSKKILDEIDAFKAQVNDKSKASLLYKHLKEYKENLINFDTLLNQEIHEKYIVVSNNFDSLKQTEKEFWDIISNGISKTRALAILTRFQNNIWNIQLNMLRYYLRKSETNYCDYFDSYKFIISQNSTHVFAKEQMEINVGMGSFTSQFHPKVKIGSNSCEMNPDGSFTSLFKAPTMVGKHIIPVKVEYVNRSGKKQTFAKDIIYYVDSYK